MQPDFETESTDEQPVRILAASLAVSADVSAQHMKSWTWTWPGSLDPGDASH